MNICRTEDTDGIQWHALSIAEWLCENWEKILFASKPPIPISADSGVLYEIAAKEETDSWPIERVERIAERRFSWWTTHNLRGGRQGGAFPNIVFWPQGNQMEISWLNDLEPFARTNIKFTPQPGRAQVLLADVISEFEKFLGGVVGRLDQADVHTERSEKVRAQIANLDSEQSKAKAIFESLGVSSPAIHEIVGLSIAEVHAGLADASTASGIWAKINSSLRLGPGEQPPSLETLGDGSAPLALFRSLSPRLTVSDVQQLKRNCLDVPKNEDACKKLVDLATRTERRMAAALKPAAHAIGMARAKKFRSVLQYSANKKFDVERFLSEQLKIRITTSSLSDNTIEAASLWDEFSGPVISVNRSANLSGTPWTRRMTLAHELCHLLFDSEHGLKLGIASGPWASLEIEQT